MLVVVGLKKVDVLLFSLFGSFWLFVGVFLVRAWRENRKLFLQMGEAFAAFALISFLVMEETRVFSLLSWPILMRVLVSPCDTVFSENERLKWGSLCFIIGLLLPTLIVWEGHAHSSALLSDVLVAMDYFGIRSLRMVHDNWQLMPFR